MFSMSETALCDAEVRYSISCSVAFNFSNCSLIIHSIQLWSEHRLQCHHAMSNITLFVWEGLEVVLEGAVCMEALQVLGQI